MFNIFWYSTTLKYNKNKMYKISNCTVDPEIFPILSFQKSVRNSFLHKILCMVFLEKYFSCYVLFTDQISLSDCLYFLGNMCIGITWFPIYNITNFEVHLIFLIKPFFYMTTKIEISQEQKQFSR